MSVCWKEKNFTSSCRKSNQKNLRNPFCPQWLLSQFCEVKRFWIMEPALVSDWPMSRASEYDHSPKQMNLLGSKHFFCVRVAVLQCQMFEEQNAAFRFVSCGCGLFCFPGRRRCGSKQPSFEKFSIKRSTPLYIGQSVQSGWHYTTKTGYFGKESQRK